MEKKQQTQGDERLQVYEVGFHIVPIVSVDTLPAEVNAIRSLIESNGGVIISEEAPKSRGLAYDISRMRGGKREKFDNAFFGWVKFEIPALSIAAIKEGMEKNENILRYLIIKTVRESTLASIMKAPMRDGVQRDSKDGQEKPVISDEKKPVSEAEAGKPKMSTEEMDKTIDDMVN